MRAPLWACTATLFRNSTAAVNEASRNLPNGSYSPKLSADLIPEQLRQLELFIGNDLDVSVPLG